MSIMMFNLGVCLDWSLNKDVELGDFNPDEIAFTDEVNNLDATFTELFNRLR